MKYFDVLVAGYGVSGKSAVNLSCFLKKTTAVIDERAVSPDDVPPGVEILDQYNAAEPLPFRAGTAVISPGIRAGNPLLEQIAAASDRVAGELAFAAAETACPLVGITGTNGKTTTTELTTALFQALGEKAEAAGNIGAGLSDGVIAARKGEVERLIVEVSSFQMEYGAIPVQAAAVLNLASDHIDRHGTADAYAQLKFSLANAAEKAVVLNANLQGERKKFLRDGLPVITFSAWMPDADLTLENGKDICYKKSVILSVDECRLKGRHNVENMMAALALVAAVKGEGVLKDERIRQALRDFQPDHHRAECFLERDGIRFVDDSKATNPHAVNAALDLFSDPAGGKNTLLLLGGLDKDMDFAELIPHLGSVKKIYLAGQCRAKIKAALDGVCPMEDCGRFDDAAAAMCRDAVSGDVVLLSPATASMDEFRNYKERGDRFKAVCTGKL